MTATLRVAVSETAAMLKIPNQALRFRPSGAGARIERENANQPASSRAPATIWLVGKDGQPNPVAVRVGVSDDASTALLEGPLQEGQQVITGIAHSQDPAGYFGIRLGF
jgi:HlyD family secretion protein